MILSFAQEFSGRSQTVKPRIANVADRRYVVSDMQSDNGRGHHGEPRVLLGHLMNRSIGALNRELHQVFDISIFDPMTKGFIEYFDCGLGSNFAGFSAAHAISHG